MKKVKVKFKLNGKPVEIECEPAKTLLDLLREDMGLMGTKKGCGIGECGACTVILNGETVNSCMMLAPQAEGADIITIEGLEEGEKMHPIQKAFIEKGAVQCGFCTPGMILSAKVLLDKISQPSREQIRRAIAGNVCRCTGYKQIVDAIQYAGDLLADDSE
ncbi:MAG: (2Fe-2S)-binding protein [Elusimicrobiota bacterium]